MRIHYCFLLVLLALLLAHATLRAQARVHSPAEISKLIADLASPKFRVREQATQELIKLDKQAMKALVEASTSNDLEVRNRVRHILREIEKHRIARLLEDVASTDQRGHLELFLEKLVAAKDFINEDCWRQLIRQATKLADCSMLATGRTFELPAQGFLKFPVDIEEFASDRLQVAKERRFLLDCLSFHLAISDCVIVAADQIRVDLCIRNSVVFCNGSIKVLHGSIGNCLVFCQGDIRVLGGGLVDSLILATGRVTVERAGMITGLHT